MFSLWGGDTVACPASFRSQLKLGVSCRTTQRPQAGEVTPIRSAEKQQASKAEEHALEGEKEMVAAVTINAAAA